MIPSTQPGFLEIVWRDDYECGDATIDAQHRNLFVSGNALLDAILTGEPEPEVQRLLDAFASEVEFHFLTEENLLEARNPLIARAHRVVHQKLLKKAHSLCTGYRTHKVRGGELISFLTYDVIREHIAKEDRRWFAPVGDAGP